jgi:hypothetical protein
VRQGQQNRRGRGRNNNRKGHHNPLSRSFESNGPDVKIRGTPSHIAEKYISLARDAQSTGDPVLAENYLQHAEHYSRIIMAYREQLNQPGDTLNGGGHRMRGAGDVGEGLDDFGDEHGHDAAVAEDGFPQPALPQGPQQARPQGGEHGRQDRPFRRDQNRPRYDRGERHGFADRDRQPEGRAEPQERAPEQEADGAGDQPRRRDRFQQVHEQPEFLRRPVRRARSENGDPGKSEPRE